MSWDRSVLGQMSLLATRVHFIKQMSLNFGSWAAAFLLLILTNSRGVRSEFLVSGGCGKCCLQFVPPELQTGDCYNNC